MEPVTEDKLTVPYNPNLLVTYKAIAGTYAAPESPTFLTDKVTDIEWSLHRARENQNALNALQYNVNSLEEQIVEWANPNYDKDDVLRELCEHFGINPVKQVSFDAVITVSGVIEVPFDEIDDFDAESILMEELSIDTNHGNIEIHDWSIDRCNEGM